jgi:hypothetical protein
MLQTNATAMEKVPEDQLARCEFWKDLAVSLESLDATGNVNSGKLLTEQASVLCM